MKYNIPCFVIQDLLPNYIENLTSEDTSTEIKKHLETCEDCKKIYHLMKSSENEGIVEEEKKEIDFLKKTRNQTRRTIFMSIALILCVFCIIAANHFYIVGTESHNDYIEVLNILLKDSHTISVVGLLNHDAGFKDMRVDNQEGVLHLTFKETIKSGIYPNSFQENYTSADEITEIWVGQQIVWKDGVSISPEIASLYNAETDDEQILDILHIKSFLVTYKTELQTKNGRYGWKISSNKNFLHQEKDYAEQVFRLYACALLARIDQLSYVTFECPMDGVNHSLTFTVEDASKYAGEDIKVIGSDIAKLEIFAQKSGLINEIIADESMTSHITAEKVIDMCVINEAESIKSISVSCYTNDDLLNTQSKMHTNNSLIDIGEKFTFEWTESALNMQSDESTKVFAKLKIIDVYDAEHEVLGEIDINKLKQPDYFVYLRKNSEGEYIISE